jgi:hypothetical protein
MGFSPSTANPDGLKPILQQKLHKLFLREPYGGLQLLNPFT